MDVLAAMTLGLLVIPQAYWPMYQYTPDHNAVFTSPSWNVSWRADVGKECAANPGRCVNSETYVAGQINGGLSIVGTTLYAESFDRRMYAFDVITGRQKWSQLLVNLAMNTPVVANGLVVVGTSAGSVYTVDPTGATVFGSPGGDKIYAFQADTGALAWQFDTLGENMPTGIATAGEEPAFIFTNGDEHAYGLAMQTGLPKWKVNTLGGGIMSSLAESGSVIYGSTGWGLYCPASRDAYAKRDASALSRLGRTWALNEVDGKFLWTSPYGRGLGSPTVADGLVFVESSRLVNWTDPNLARSEVDALDQRTGKLVWQYVSLPGWGVSRGSNLDAIASTYDSGVLYQALPYPKQFAAFDARTGRVLWSVPTHSTVKMSSLVRDGQVYFGDTDGYLYMVRAFDGKVENQLKFPSIFTCSPPLIVGTTLFVANGPSIYAIKLDDLQQGHLPAGAASPAPSTGAT